MSLTVETTTTPLLRIPLELRLEIFKDVLVPDDADSFLYYLHGIITPISTTLHICRQIRNELLPDYFRNRTVWFYTFGELGAALLLAPSTVPFWSNLQISWTGRRVLTRNGKRWTLEPGLEMVVKIPNLKSLSLDTDTVLLCGDRGLEREVELITNQIRDAIPQHGSLQTISIAGRAARHEHSRGRCSGMETAFGDWKRVFKHQDGSWQLDEDSSTRLDEPLHSFKCPWVRRS